MTMNNSVPWMYLDWRTLTRMINKLSMRAEFKEQLERDKAGWYQTSLTWKANEMGNKKQLDNLIRKPKKNELYKEYNAIIEEQLQHGIVEVAPKISTGNEYYIPHKAVVKKEAESTCKTSYCLRCVCKRR